MAKEYQTKIQCDFGATMKFMYDNLLNNLGTHYCKTVLNSKYYWNTNRKI